MRVALALIICIHFCMAADASLVVDFEELDFFTGDNPAGGGQFFNGNDRTNTTNSNGWSSRGVFFNNSYNGDFLPGFDFWNGWAYSNVVNTTTAGIANQYAAFSGGGVEGSQNYAMASGSGAFFNIPVNTIVTSVSLSNATYSALSMQDGDAFAKKFGGLTGDDPDFFRVSLSGFDGLNGAGNMTGSVTVDLADYTFADNSLDYILSTWRTVDLTALGAARSVAVNFESSDVGAFGINTPTYLALDNLALTAVPEPSCFALLAAGAVAVLICRGKAKVRQAIGVASTTTESTVH